MFDGSPVFIIYLLSVNLYHDHPIAIKHPRQFIIQHLRPKNLDHTTAMLPLPSRTSESNSSSPANARSTSITTASGPDTFGTLNQFPSRNLSYQIGISDTQGRRSAMEDTYGFVVDFDAVRGQGLFAIFDGHGNKSAAEWCGAEFYTHILEKIQSQRHAPTEAVLTSAFESMDQSLLKLSESPAMAGSGCTAVTAFLRIEDVNGQQPFISSPMSNSASNSSHPSRSCQTAINPPASCRRVLYCANAGDSRAVLSRGGRAIRLTYDHKASDVDEIQRIKKEGGLFFQGRVSGYLSVTRSLGDHDSEDGFSLKKFVISVPYTTRTELLEEDEFLILACDGIWDVMTDEQAVNHIRHIQDTQEASRALLNFALSEGTGDNVTVMVVRFKAPAGV